MSITGTPWDLLLLGLAVLASFAYGYLEGRATGFRRGVRAAREKDDCRARSERVS